MSYFHCPGCDYEFDIEYASRHITYWGEDPAKSESCPRCSAELEIEEHVSRYWAVTMVATATPSGGEQE